MSLAYSRRFYFNKGRDQESWATAPPSTAAAEATSYFCKSHHRWVTLHVLLFYLWCTISATYLVKYLYFSVQKGNHVYWVSWPALDTLIGCLNLLFTRDIPNKSFLSFNDCYNAEKIGILCHLPLWLLR